MKNRLRFPAVLTTLVLTAACGQEAERAAEEPTLTAKQPALVQAMATYDATLMAPSCTMAALSCDSGSLVTGRSAYLGPEANAPNTLGGSCPDGTSGSFHYDESVDAVKVITTTGTNMAAGKPIQLQVKVWAGSYYTADKLDLYYTTDAAQPTWRYLTTLSMTGSGARSFTHTFTLQSGSSMQAVRAQLRYGGSASPCTTSTSYPFNNEADDLAFFVEPGSGSTSGVVNGGFESALSSWTSSGTVRAETSGLSHGGTSHAVLQPAYPTPARISQQVQLPTTARTLQFYYRIESGRTDAVVSNLRVRIVPSSGYVFDSAIASNLYASGSYALYSMDISQYAGQSVRLDLEAHNTYISTSEVYRIDDVLVQ
ncbi:hypothetical protein ACN28E_33085 [Archangium lansingense]|uniref:hypothetical protein n=1 Tax=Archangium lansingense TaxID=2995310 RepID=UPI003B7F940D